MTHHPHVHMIVPGGGLSLDGSTWVARKPNFFLPVFALSKLFRRLMLEKLAAAHAAGKLTFFGEHAHLAEAAAFNSFLAPLLQDQVVRLFQAPVRSSKGRARVTLALYSSGRHLQPAHCCCR